MPNLKFQDEFFSQSNTSKTDGEFSSIKPDNEQIISENDFQPSLYASINHHTCYKNHDDKAKSYIVHNVNFLFVTHIKY